MNRKSKLYAIGLTLYLALVPLFFHARSQNRTVNFPNGYSTKRKNIDLVETVASLYFARDTDVEVEIEYTENGYPCNVRYDLEKFVGETLDVDRVMAEADANGDKTVSRMELVELAAEMMEQIHERKGKKTPQIPTYIDPKTVG